MPLHLYFDYTLPFTVGDAVYVPFDAPGTDRDRQHIDYNYIKGEIFHINIIFIANANYGTTITEPKEEHEIGLSGFMISIYPDRKYNVFIDPIFYSHHNPNIFLKEEDIISYQKNRSR